MHHTIQLKPNSNNLCPKILNKPKKFRKNNKLYYSANTTLPFRYHPHATATSLRCTIPSLFRKGIKRERQRVRRYWLFTKMTKNTTIEAPPVSSLTYIHTYNLHIQTWSNITSGSLLL